MLNGSAFADPAVSAAFSDATAAAFMNKMENPDATNSFSYSSGLELGSFQAALQNNNNLYSTGALSPSSYTQRSMLNNLQTPMSVKNAIRGGYDGLFPAHAQRSVPGMTGSLAGMGRSGLDSLTMPSPSGGNRAGYDNHNMPPSKVIHCRAVADGCKETDLFQVMRPFGNIRALTLMPKLRQALVEFDQMESAIACVTYAKIQAILVLGRQMYVNYSKSTEINRDFSKSTASIGQTPTNTLLFTIINAIQPVSVDTIKKICTPHADVQRIVIFHKNGLQALVEFVTVEEARRVQQALNSCDIFQGCCTLKIDFSKTGRLNVHANTAETYDVEIEKRKCGGSLLALINQSNRPAMLSPNTLTSAFPQQNKSIPGGMQPLSDVF